MSTIEPCIICGPWKGKGSFGGYTTDNLRLCNDCALEKFPWEPYKKKYPLEYCQFLADSKACEERTKDIFLFIEKENFKMNPGERAKKQSEQFEKE